MVIMSPPPDLPLPTWEMPVMPTFPNIPEETYSTGSGSTYVYVKATAEGGKTSVVVQGTGSKEVKIESTGAIEYQTEVKTEEPVKVPEWIDKVETVWQELKSRLRSWLGLR